MRLSCMTVYFDNYSLIDYLAMICFISFLGFCQENICVNTFVVVSVGEILLGKTVEGYAGYITGIIRHYRFI